MALFFPTECGFTEAMKEIEMYRVREGVGPGGRPALSATCTLSIAERRQEEQVGSAPRGDTGLDCSSSQISLCSRALRLSHWCL